MCLYRHRLLPFFKGMDLIHAKKTAGFNRSEFFKPASHGVVLMIMTMSRIAMIIAPPRTKTSRLSELVCGSLLSFMLLLSGDSFRFGERPGMIGEGRCDSLNDKCTGIIKKGQWNLYPRVWTSTIISRTCSSCFLVSFRPLWINLPIRTICMR
jgi:hypothetical protein